MRSQTLDGSATVTAEIIRTFDTLGRQTSYTDADGNVSTATYDIGSRVATTNDGLATRTYTYDGGSERRGLPTQVVDSLAGTFTASYDLDGNLVAQTWPNGVTVQTSFDEADDAIGVNYSLPGCGSLDCTLYTESAQLGVHGEWLTRSSTLSTQGYAHDNAGRLTQVNDTVDGQCTVRVYAYGTATNRTGLTTYNPGSGGACQTSASAGATTWTYDAADRASGSGYIYDALGRTLTMPGSDTAIPGGGTETMTYHVNDMVRSINQGSRTTIYTLDVVANRIRSWTDDTTGSTVTKINHYTNDGDSPSWTYEGGASLSRIMIGLDGMVGTQNSDVDRAWTIANLHGDLVAGMDSTSVGLIYTSEYDENGQPRNSVDAGTRRYGYLGSAQRAADTPGGLSLMGARLYAPGSGRFLSTDPITGGSCNAYEYACGDPAGSSDISGTSNSENPGGGSYVWLFCKEKNFKHWRNFGFHSQIDVKCTLPAWWIDLLNNEYSSIDTFLYNLAAIYWCSTCSYRRGFANCWHHNCGHWWRGLDHECNIKNP